MTNSFIQKPGGNITLDCYIKEFYGKSDEYMDKGYFTLEPIENDANSYFGCKNIEIYCRTQLLNPKHPIEPGSRALISGLFDCAWVKKPNTVCILLSYIDSLMIEALSAT